MASIAAAKLGATSVLATDSNPEVLALARRNIERNGVASVATTAALQWGLLDATEYEGTADVIIGSDLTYNSGSWLALAETMATLLKPGGVVIYLVRAICLGATFVISFQRVALSCFYRDSLPCTTDAGPLGIQCGRRTWRLPLRRRKCGADARGAGGRGMDGPQRGSGLGGRGVAPRDCARGTERRRGQRRGPCGDFREATVRQKRVTSASRPKEGWSQPVFVVAIK